jgi:hypothetical protein
MHELPVDYINPPPTYATSGQRLRTPSEVIAGADAAPASTLPS